MTSEYILRILIRSYRFNRYDSTLIHLKEQGANGAARVMILKTKSGNEIYGWKNGPNKKRTSLYLIKNQRMIEAVLAFSAIQELSQ